MWLILGKNLWVDNAGVHSYKKQNHMRTRGKDEILSRNGNVWSLYDFFAYYEGYQDLISYIEIVETIASIIFYVKIYITKSFWKISSIRNFWDGLYMH